MAPEDDRALVLLVRNPEEEIALAAAGRAAVQQNIGRVNVGCLLRLVLRIRLPAFRPLQLPLDFLQQQA